MGTVLGANIRRLRLDRGLTQLQLAKKLGKKSKSVVCNWETGVNPPPSTLLPRLAEELGATIGDLYVEHQAEAA